MTWHILGQGSIGLLWAYHWRKAQQQVCLLDRHLNPKQQPLTTHREFSIETYDQKQQTFRCQLSPISTNPIGTSESENHTINQLLVPLKAFDVVNAVKSVLSRLSENAIIVLCHNGMGTIEPIKALLKPTQQLYFATTTHGSYRNQHQGLIHSGLGQTKIGAISEHQPDSTSAQLFKASINQGLAPVSWHQDIEQILWAKLAINCVINPLTAINDCQNGQLTQTQYRPIIEAICREFVTIAQLNQIQCDDNQILTQVYQVIEATAANYSSMHQDIKAKRPSEIDFITGFILAKAKQQQIKLPAMEKIYHQVLAL